jgi:uncharacterized Zn finger protein
MQQRRRRPKEGWQERRQERKQDGGAGPEPQQQADAERRPAAPEGQQPAGKGRRRGRPPGDERPQAEPRPEGRPEARAERRPDAPEGQQPAGKGRRRGRGRPDGGADGGAEARQEPRAQANAEGQQGVKERRRERARPGDAGGPEPRQEARPQAPPEGQPVGKGRRRGRNRPGEDGSAAASPPPERKQERPERSEERQARPERKQNRPREARPEQRQDRPQEARPEQRQDRPQEARPEPRADGQAAQKRRRRLKPRPGAGAPAAQEHTPQPGPRRGAEGAGEPRRDNRQERRQGRPQGRGPLRPQGRPGDRFQDRRSPPRLPADGIKARTQQGEFGESWWARRWVTVLESFGYGGRLARGRTYARGGAVLSIEQKKGTVTARVQGSRPSPYHVRITVPPLSDEQWARVIDAMAEQAIFSAKLLAGEMPMEIEEAFATAQVPLFPRSARDLATNCSCPDPVVPCKHIAAVYYLLGERFDSDPFLLFELRGRDKEQVGAALRAMRAREVDSLEPAPALEVERAPALEELIATFDLPGADLAQIAPQIAAPELEAPLLRRYGPSPAATAEDLAVVYRTLTKLALNRLLGEE